MSSKNFRLGSGGQGNQSPTQAVQTNQNTTNKTKWEYAKEQDWFRIPVSAALALIVYFSILFFMPEYIEDWQRHGATLGLSILFFAFIGFAQKKPGSLGDAIITCLGLIFAFAMAVCYL